MKNDFSQVENLLGFLIYSQDQFHIRCWLVENEFIWTCRSHGTWPFNVIDDNEKVRLLLFRLVLSRLYTNVINSIDEYHRASPSSMADWHWRRIHSIIISFTVTTSIDRRTCRNIGRCQLRRIRMFTRIETTNVESTCTFDTRFSRSSRKMKEQTRWILSSTLDNERAVAIEYRMGNELLTNSSS
jgi:hypothetical protein